MSKAYEQISIQADAPTPEQLFHLASRGVLLAKQYDKFRAMPASVINRSHVMLPPAQIIIPDLLEAPFGFRYEHRHSARIARKDYRVWSMRMFSTFHVTEMGSELGSERHVYSFEWTKREATLALHKFDVLPITENPDILDDIDRFLVPEDMAEEWSWRLQMATMNSGDVNILSQSLDALIE